jgi:oligoendopeptidase F
LNFLKSGCSKYPLELLSDAGVDMASPKPIATALQHFDGLVDQLTELL